MVARFAAFGFTITDLIIENLSLPKEVEEAMDKRTSMGVLGNMQQYQQYQAAEAMRDAAQNEGGMAGAGVGMGAGMGMGQVMANAMNQQNNQPQQPQAATKACPHCQATINADAKFCGQCGKSVKTDRVPCIKCETMIPKDAKFCNVCGTSQVTEKICPACSHANLPGAKFCADCGETLDVK